MKTIILITITCLTMAGCASTLPQKSVVQGNYSVTDAKTFSTALSCDATKVDGVKDGFVKDYCQILAGNIKIALQKELRGIEYNETNPDLAIQVNLEEVNGGSAAARLWVGMGAGRSITTVYVKVIKKGVTIAEKRLTETTTTPNLITNNYANDDAILQDAPLVARKVGEFVKNPARE